MKGYSYPGESPNKQLSVVYGDKQRNVKPGTNNKKTDPNIDNSKSKEELDKQYADFMSEAEKVRGKEQTKWGMDWGKALKTLLSSGLSKKGIMKALGQGLKVPSKKSQNEQGRMTVEDYLKRMSKSMKTDADIDKYRASEE